MSAQVKVLASAETWIEGEAVRQLEATARLPGMRLAVGMPDLHPGRGNPIGAVFASQGWVYPHLVGSDIGCGMALFGLEMRRHKARRDAIARRMTGFDGPWDGNTGLWLEQYGLRPLDFDLSDHDLSLGTIGGGNHFAEVQVVEDVSDTATLEALGIDPEHLVLLVHSGSRVHGDAVLRAHAAKHKADGLADDSEEAGAYLGSHDALLVWARANRALIAHRFAECLGTGHRVALDVCHNSVSRARIGGETCWLHRKGAAPHDSGPVVIPGSRGAMSYVVMPAGDGELCAHSLAHGAGRKWSRADARSRMKDRVQARDLLRTPLGNDVICDDKELLYEEAPQAYKDIDRVIGDLVSAGVARVVATLRPIVTYKVRSPRLEARHPHR
jgi:release factor H-coupled RctB family protein